jgi:hypothetical protein
MSIPGSRTERLPIGIAGALQGQIDREVPASEPPPLALNADLAVIGKPVPRVGGRAMVTGAAHYTVDVKLPGMLIARILRSPYPVWSKYWSEASISSIENLIALITVPVPHRRPG